MNEQELLELKNSLDSIEGLVTQIYANLSGRVVNVENIAGAISALCPDIPMDDLIEDCGELLHGIRNGSAYAQRLMEMSDEELEKALPDCLTEALEGMSEDQQHQYLIIMYQFLCEKMDRSVSGEEAIYIANATNGELLDKIVYLMQFAQVEVMSDTAEIVHNCMLQLQNRELNPAAAEYTEEERTWILAAAMYADAQDNQSEKIPAVLIGETVGISATTGHEFRNAMLSQVIPTAVAVLAVAATCALAYWGIKALMAHSLFTTVLTWAQKYYSMTLIRYGIGIGTLTVMEPVIKNVWDVAFSATAALTCRFIKDDSHARFHEAYEPMMISDTAADENQMGEPIYVSDDLEEIYASDYEQVSNTYDLGEDTYYGSVIQEEEIF